MADLSRMEAAEQQRDARLRRVMLRTLHRAIVSPRGGLSGTALMQAIGTDALPGDELEGEQHALTLARYLVGAGYATEQDMRKERLKLFGMHVLFFAITAKGSALAEKRIAPDPMIDDERNLEE